MSRIRRYTLSTAHILAYSLLGVSMAPCWAGPLALLQDVGSVHEVSTEVSPTPGSFLNAFIGADYILSGEVQVGQATDKYETPPTTKLQVFQIPQLPPFVVGVDDSEGRGVTDRFHNYSSAAESSISTTPLGITGSQVGIDLGVVFGVKATLEVKADIEPIDPQTRPLLLAQALAADPFLFTKLAPADALGLSSSLRTGDSFSVQEATDSVLNSMVVSTDIPGLETLYRLDILATGTGASTGSAADTALQIRFAANPLLGISDATITQAVLNSITFDNSAEQFVFTADVSLFDGLVQIPDQVNEFHLFITQSLHRAIRHSRCRPSHSDHNHRR